MYFCHVLNSDLYNSFVNEDWKLDDLLKRFQDQTNLGNAAIWSTEIKSSISIKFLFEKSNQKSFREIHSKIKVTNGRLWLTNYEDLSMAAQYADEKIPSVHNSDLKITLQNGSYQILIRQLFNTIEYDLDCSLEPCYEVVFTKV